ncbi:MAG: aldo/keto reductase [Erysipelotrichaceae bacterium]
MIYKQFKDIRLSTLGLGNMRLPLVEPKNPQSNIDWPKAHQIIDYAIENGINYFDTAYVYNNGESERCLGAALAKHDRNKFFVATKFNINSNSDYRAVFEEQLQRLQLESIDFYLIHCLMDNNIDKYLESGCIDYFKQLKAEGKIRYLGFSSHSGVETLERFVQANDWDFAQLQINYFDWNYSKTQQEYQILKDHNIPIMVMEPVRGGRLATLNQESEQLLKSVHPDWSIAAWSLRFVRTLNQTQVILSGMSDMNQIVDNINTFSDEATLNEQEMTVLMQACELFHKSLVVGCTGCRYCCENCPVSINIPEFMKVYNTYKTLGKRQSLQMIAQIDSQSTPVDCLGCGNCQASCPQNIKIPELMEELKILF